MTDKNEIMTLPVKPEQAKMRLDKWLAQATELSRSRLSCLIEQGQVFLNGIPVTDQDRKTVIGDIYQIILPPPVEAVPQAQNIPLEIIYDTSGGHDNVLGRCGCKDCQGKKYENLYGKVLMRVREELKAIHCKDQKE